ncbi:Flagellar biosynthesis protein flhF Flagella-associated GTP-binding protein [Proteiniborus sp. DW1]|uniref:flagellar biosynthesis protein FlhF n=1 Tax=Proteiniborus sp. DW1 TaxID=1889883 RepID=UPI00092DEFD9|nr:flagellar biosynthesis protein FlhF [Proteiniborus sp. DW1]SCG83432.1 Flagellar biosynthesis protein flhF Flagella-associated GTP-binding protein [Proteiniborus sp. DW1]
MKIKRYLGSSTQEAMDKVKKELGSDAIILHTRSIKQPGLMGFFKRNLIEVVAAIEEKNMEKEYLSNFPNMTKDNYINVNKSHSLKNKDHLEDEIKRIRTIVEKVANTLDTKKNELPEVFSNYYDSLIDNGVNKEVAFQILDKINQQINITNKDSIQVQEIILYSIRDYLGESSPITYDGKQKIIFFIGPTGVGKTTTLAKLAANFSITQNHDVGLITADTYRIAAVEQLKVYSEIMNIPIKVVYEIKDIYKSLSNFKDKDIILVDTAGRSHKNEEQMNEIMELINSVNNKEIHLVINATTDFETIRDVLNRYSFIADFKIIFSKIDEALNLGNILNTKFYFNYPVSYLTTGQNVPDDIEIPNMDKLSKCLIGVSSYA